MKSTYLKIALALSLMTGLSVTAQADTIYNISSTALINCSDSPHGLWTNSTIGGGSCSNYFDFQAGSILTIHDTDADSANWTATLTATATNPFDVVATIDLLFSDFTDDHTTIGYKAPIGGHDPADWTFFRDVSGVINILGTDYLITHNAGDKGLQIGWGANDKTSAFGASAWLKGSNLHPSGHWDINMDLELADVPEPGFLSLSLLGLIAFSRLSAQRRRRVSSL